MTSKIISFTKLSEELRVNTKHPQLHIMLTYQTRSTENDIAKQTVSGTFNIENTFFSHFFQELNNLTGDIKSSSSSISFQKA